MKEIITCNVVKPAIFSHNIVSFAQCYHDLQVTISVVELGVFGVPLPQLVQEDRIRNEHITVPLFYLEVFITYALFS